LAATTAGAAATTAGAAATTQRLSEVESEAVAVATTFTHKDTRASLENFRVLSGIVAASARACLEDARRHHCSQCPERAREALQQWRQPAVGH